jgi:hypothetical protein
MWKTIYHRREPLYRQRFLTATAQGIIVFPIAGTRA